MDADDWSMVMKLEIEDFVEYWKKRAGKDKFPREMSFFNWIKEFSDFNRDRQ